MYKNKLTYIKYMSRFLRLTTAVINVNQIRKIDIRHNEYKINLIKNNYTNFCIIHGVSETLNVCEDYIIVSQKDHIDDYKLVSKWIQDDKTNNV
jgi:hypothetical protein